MFARTGDTTEPWGVPRRLSRHSPASIATHPDIEERLEGEWHCHGRAGAAGRRHQGEGAGRAPPRVGPRHFSCSTTASRFDEDLGESGARSPWTMSRESTTAEAGARMQPGAGGRGAGGHAVRPSCTRGTARSGSRSGTAASRSSRAIRRCEMSSPSGSAPGTVASSMRRVRRSRSCAPRCLCRGPGHLFRAGGALKRRNGSVDGAEGALFRG